MAKIIYTIAGEGMGHALRSKCIIDELKKRKHDVMIFSSHRPCQFLKKIYPNVHETYGQYMVYKNNQLMNWRTFWANAFNLTSSIKAIKKIKKAIKDYKADLVITDFEMFGAISALQMEKPLVNIDNQHVIKKCKIKVSKRYWYSWLLTRITIGFLIPKADYFLITTFFYPEIKKKNAFLFPPIVRDDVLKLKPKKGKHVLVYQTSDTYIQMFPILKKFKNEKFVLYGFHVNKKDENLVFKEHSKEGFLRDLVNAKAVIMNGGFSLMSECIYLQKPIFSIPVRRQFEQILNATYLEKLNYGKFEEKITEENLKEFLKNLPKYRKNLKKCKFDNNKAIMRKLEQIIKEAKK